jgi:hypothetical protein
VQPIVTITMPKILGVQLPKRSYGQQPQPSLSVSFEAKFFCESVQQGSSYVSQYLQPYQAFLAAILC